MSCCVCFSRQTACDRRRRELRSVGRCTMRGIEVLVKPGTHTRLAFDLYIPCMAKVIVSKGRRVKGGSCATRATRSPHEGYD